MQYLFGFSPSVAFGRGAQTKTARPRGRAVQTAKGRIGQAAAATSRAARRRTMPRPARPTASTSMLAGSGVTMVPSPRIMTLVPSVKIRAVVESALMSTGNCPNCPWSRSAPDNNWRDLDRGAPPRRRRSQSGHNFILVRGISRRGRATCYAGAAAPGIDPAPGSKGLA